MLTLPEEELPELEEELPLLLEDEEEELLLLPCVPAPALTGSPLVSFAIVFMPTFPSAVKPFFFWNALTASSVTSPKYPVQLEEDI